MPTAAARILETALALQHAPGERFRLRERPLPPGIVHAIEIAAGSPQVLQEVAGELGEPEPVLVDAARFYLEQLLFADPDATAYRVLGVAPDATHEAIRAHHRWLQRWLHPDRAQAGDASVFATRVNQAFAQLRSPESRHAYDVRLAEARLADASATLSPETVRHWEHEDESPRHGRRSRWLLAAALVACVVLAVLIVRNPDKSAPWNPDEVGEGAVAAAEPGPAIEDRDLGVLGAALAVRPLEADSTASTQPVAPTPPEAPSSQVAVVAPPANPLRALVAAALRPLHRSGPQAGVVSAVSTVPAAPRSAAATGTGAPTVVATTSMQERAASIPLDTASQPVVAATIASPSAVASQQAPPPPPPPPGIRPEDVALVAARLPLAEQRITQLTGYLAARPGVVPLWDNVQAMSDTNAARQRINARKGSRFELARPAWRMRPEQADLSADYRCRSGDGAPCGGRLEVTLVWREGLWLVRGITLGPSA